MNSIPASGGQNQQPTGPSSTIEALKREQQRRRELEHYISWEDKLFRNRHISAGQKLRLRALRRSVERGKTRDDAGRTRINLTTISDDTGESPDSIGRAIKFFEKCNLIPDKKLVPEIQENGEQWKRWYISLNQELLTHPDQITPPEPRNHGGDRTYICSQCGKKHLIKRKKVTLICKDCGHESLLSETDEDLSPAEEQDAAYPPEDDTNKNFCEQGSNLPDVLKPVAPPIGSKLQGGSDDERDLEVEQENQVDFGAAAELLLSLAGDSDEHIEMSRTGQKKYYTVHRRLNQEDLLDHFGGGQARGGLCSRVDGKTRGLCWDADNQDDWELLLRAARALVAVGYLVILEESPVGRGGHLWIIYTDLVDAIAARRHVCELVPELQDLEEYWPGPQDAASWNRVRLPGGKYVRYGKYVEVPVKAWCKLISVADGETSQDGRAAAALLLSHQTPVDLVPTPPSDEHGEREVRDVPDPELALAGVEVGASQLGRGEISQQIEPSSILRPGEHEEHVAAIGSESERTLPVVDACWIANYGDVQTTTFWFAIVEDYSAAWFNDHHSLEEIRPRERNGMALSPNGSERSASTGYHVTPDGERYTDFSTHGRLPDGRRDSGDVLELAMKVWNRSKSSILAETAREITSQARTEMEAAARAEELPPAWVQELMTPAGWRRYDSLRPSTSQPPAGENTASAVAEPPVQTDQEDTPVLDEAVDEATARTLTTLTAYTAHLAPGMRVALDLETTGLDRYQHTIVSVQLGIQGEEACILDVRPYYDLSEAEQRVWQRALQTLFAMPDITWLGHNLKFDWLFLVQHFGVKPGRSIDTMIVEQVLRNGEKEEKGKYALKNVAARYGLAVSKEEQLATTTLKDGDELSAQLLAYMAQDVTIPHQVYAAQQALIEEAKVGRVIDLEHEALLAVIAMEHHGAMVDRAQLAQIVEIKQQKKTELEAVLLPVLAPAYHQAQTRRASEKAGASQDALWSNLPERARETFKLSSNPQLQLALAELGVIVQDTRAETLEAVMGRHACIPILVEWRKVQKLVSTLTSQIAGHICADGRIHTQFSLAQSGRYTTRTPNVQGIPKQKEGGSDAEDPRRCIVAPSGSLLLQADLSNIELRILAEVSGDATMLRFFAEGKDLHAETARLMFNLAPDANTKKTLVHGVPARVIAKTINFGLAYGMGAQRLADRVGVDLSTARELLQKYADTYMGVTAYLRHSGRAAIARGYAESLSGRKRSFPVSGDYWKLRREIGGSLLGDYERSAKNHPIQGTNADILKRALALLYARLPEGAHIVLSIHDEVILECLESQIEAAKDILQRSMMDACREFLKVVRIPDLEINTASYWKKD